MWQCKAQYKHGKPSLPHSGCSSGLTTTVKHVQSGLLCRQRPQHMVSGAVVSARDMEARPEVTSRQDGWPAPLPPSRAADRFAEH